MDFIEKDWQLIFGGLGTAVIAAVIGAWAKAYFERPKGIKKSDVPNQSIRAGNNSVNNQAGGDMNVGGKPK